MEKTRIDTKALLEAAKNAKVKNTNKNFSKIVGKSRNNDETRRVNFTKSQNI